MKHLFIISLCALILSACDKKKLDKTERQGEPDIYNVAGTDVGMNAAMLKAKSKMGDFDTALASGNYIGYAIKVRFNKPDGGGEHIWLNKIYKKGPEYWGVVNDDPEWTKEVKFGDTLKIDNAKISDWMYIDGMKLKGGYTIKLLRNRMSETERAAFDKDNGLIIEEEK